MFTVSGSRESVKSVVDASEVVKTSLVIVEPGSSVLNDTNVDPSVDPSYLPVLELNLMMPSSALGLWAYEVHGHA